MYYHNGKGYNIGEVITTIDGLFGRVEIAYKKFAQELTWFIQDADESPTVQAYTIGKDGQQLITCAGDTAQAALKALYMELGRIEAQQAVKMDNKAVNGLYHELEIRNRVTLGFATAADARMMPRTVNDKVLTTEIAQDELLTLERCRELAQRASGLLGDTVTRMRIFHTVDAAERQTFVDSDYYWGEGEWPIQHLVAREYRYNAERNALLVIQDNEYLMTNDDGDICNDEAAIADTLSQGYEAY